MGVWKLLTCGRVDVRFIKEKLCAGKSNTPPTMRVAAFTVLSAVLAVTSVTADFLWTSRNCPGSLGNVTDTLCCGPNTFCRKLVSEAACTSEVDEAALYCEWSEGQCQPVVDRESNVCCRDQEVNSCSKMFNGECPEEYEVARECCQGDSFTKFAFLKTSDPDKICCNAPCAAMEAANCTLPLQCGPTQRSFAFHNPPHSLGFYGYHNPAFDHHYGTIFYGTGYGHDYPPYRRRHKKHRKSKKSKKHHKKDRYDDHDDHYGHDHDDHYDDHDDHYDDHDDDYYKDYDYSKEDHVNEITVDDIFALMIDAMEKESDVKVYDADVTSDPYLGKTWSGGLFLDHHFPDVEPIFDELYRYPNHYRPYYGGLHYGPYYGGHHHGGLNYGGHYAGGYQGGHYPAGYQGAQHPGSYQEEQNPESYREEQNFGSHLGGQYPTGHQGGQYPIAYQGGQYPIGYQGGHVEQPPATYPNAGVSYPADLGALPGVYQSEQPVPQFSPPH